MDIDINNPRTKRLMRIKFKEALYKATGGCDIQHDGWTCATCFLNLDDSITNQDWQSILYLRGDYKKKELCNLPRDINKSLKKVWLLISMY